MKHYQLVIQMTAICIFASFTGRAVAAQGNTEGGLPVTTGPVSTVLVAERTVVPLGDPINVSVSVANRGHQETSVDKAETVFDCFEVVDAKGKALPYVSDYGSAQVLSQPIDVQPTSTVAIVQSLDLTDQYLFQRAGRYSIRFKGYGWGLSTEINPPPSSVITVNVTQGQLAELDGIAACLLTVLPSGWTLQKSPRHEQQVTPFGRVLVPGYRVSLVGNSRGGESVWLWLTKVKVPIDTAHKSDLTSDYLGHEKALHVYVACGSKTEALWPKAITDISRVLKIETE